MTKEEILLRLAEYAIKFGLDAAIAMAKAIQMGATIDNAIAAFEFAKTKTATQYLDEAKAEQALAGVTP